MSINLIKKLREKSRVYICLDQNFMLQRKISNTSKSHWQVPSETLENILLNLQLSIQIRVGSFLLSKNKY